LSGRRELEYAQSSDFWGVITKLQNGIDTIGDANDLLNRTYNNPAGAEISLVYKKSEINLNEITLREVRLDQVGYAVSSNPILPRLFGYEAFGPTATVGWQFLEIYGGRFFGKSVNAVSTDLIDRKLVDTDDITLFGAGIHYRYENNDAFVIPLSAELFTRSTSFSSTVNGDDFRNRVKVEIDGGLNDVDLLLLVGQNPVPGFDQKSVIWNYLWQTDNFPDFLSAVGIGVRTRVFDFGKTQCTFGFFGGYFGGRLSVNPVHNFQISLNSYGYETSASYQTTQLREFGGDLTYQF
jgi:hypothetical protein